LTCPLIVTRLVPTRRLSPRRYRMASTGGLPLAAAMGMVHRIHRYAAVHRTPSQPARASSFSDGHVFVVDVAHLPDRRHAILRAFAGLTGRQLHHRVLFFLV